MEQPNKFYIESISDGDSDFEKKLIEIIKKEFPEEKKTYNNNVSRRKNKLTAENVHKLKHKISIFGLEEGYRTAVEFENNLREGSYELKDEFEAILLTITNYLQKL